MSTAKYRWWPYVKGMIRDYPALDAKYRELHRVSMTASYSGMPGGGGGSRKTERMAIRELPTTRQREYEAVRMALDSSDKDTVQLIRLVYWSYRRYYILGAASMIGVSDRTAKRMHRRFLLLVAKYYGLLDED